MNQPNARRRQILDAYVALFNAPPGTEAGLRELLAADTSFSDPFNKIEGVAGIHALLIDFAERVQDPSFEIHRQAWDGDTCLLRWRLRGQVALLGRWSVDGVTELHFDDDDRIDEHVDYWDAAGQLYERLPVIGVLLRWLRRRLSAPAPD